MARQTDQDVLAAFNAGRYQPKAKAQRKLSDIPAMEYLSPLDYEAAQQAEQEAKPPEPEPVLQPEIVAKAEETVSNTAERAKEQLSGLVDRATGVADATYGKVGDLHGKIADMPTPGGIGILLIILLIFIWAVIPVNKQGGVSYTRLGLLWLTLTGRTYLQGRKSITEGYTVFAGPLGGGDGGGGGGSGFGLADASDQDDGLYIYPDDTGYGYDIDEVV